MTNFQINKKNVRKCTSDNDYDVIITLHHSDVIMTSSQNILNYVFSTSRSNFLAARMTASCPRDAHARTPPTHQNIIVSSNSFLFINLFLQMLYFSLFYLKLLPSDDRFNFDNFITCLPMDNFNGTIFGSGQGSIAWRF